MAIIWMCCKCFNVLVLYLLVVHIMLLWYDGTRNSCIITAFERPKKYSFNELFGFLDRYQFSHLIDSVLSSAWFARILADILELCLVPQSTYLISSTCQRN